MEYNPFLCHKTPLVDLLQIGMDDPVEPGHDVGG